MEKTRKIQWLAAVGQSLAWAAVLTAFGCASQKLTIESATEAATKGDTKAEYFLAKHYAKGEGVPQNDAKAAEYMQQAAESGYAFAQNDLGRRAAGSAAGAGISQAV